MDSSKSFDKLTLAARNDISKWDTGKLCSFLQKHNFSDCVQIAESTEKDGMDFLNAKDKIEEWRLSKKRTKQFLEFVDYVRENAIHFVQKPSYAMSPTEGEENISLAQKLSKKLNEFQKHQSTTSSHDMLNDEYDHESDLGPIYGNINQNHDYHDEVNYQAVIENENEEADSSFDEEPEDFQPLYSEVEMPEYNVSRTQMPERLMTTRTLSSSPGVDKSVLNNALKNRSKNPIKPLGTIEVNTRKTIKNLPPKMPKQSGINFNTRNKQVVSRWQVEASDTPDQPKPELKLRRTETMRISKTKQELNESLKKLTMNQNSNQDRLSVISSSPWQINLKHQAPKAPRNPPHGNGNEHPSYMPKNSKPQFKTSEKKFKFSKNDRSKLPEKAFPTNPIIPSKKNFPQRPELNEDEDGYLEARDLDNSGASTIRPLPEPPEYNDPWIQNVTREDSSQLLQGLNNGAFLFRPTKQPNCVCTLVVLHNNVDHHINVRRNPNGSIALGTIQKDNLPTFLDLNELVEFYSQNELAIITNGIVRGLVYLSSTEDIY